MRLVPSTVRGRLTLTAVVSFTALYLAIAISVQAVAWRAMLSSVDNDLRHHGSRLRQNFLQDRQNPPPRLQRGVPPMRPPRDHGQNGWRVVWSDGPAPFPFPRENPYDIPAVGRALSTKEFVFTTASQNGERSRILSVPLVTEKGATVAVVQIPVSLDAYEKSAMSLGRTLLIIMPIGLVVMTWASLAIVGRAIRPVQIIQETAERIGAGHLSGRLPVMGQDEFGQLSETINGMLARIEAAFLAKEATLQRLEELSQEQRRFTADASHELKTPLSIIKANSGLIRQSTDEDNEVHACAVEIDAAATRMNRLIQDLLLLARSDSGQFTPEVSELDVLDLLRGAISQVREPEKVQLDEPSDLPRLAGSRPALERLFVNLIENACRHTAPNEVIRLSVHVDGQEMKICVHDNGEGIAPEHLPHIFERFYRADASRRSDGGTGLGLAICKGIAEAHHGHIEVSSRLGVGSTFAVHLPLPDKFRAVPPALPNRYS